MGMVHPRDLDLESYHRLRPTPSENSEMYLMDNIALW